MHLTATLPVVYDTGMFFRTKKSPSGSVLQLVESYRDRAGRPRQRVVISLGAPAISDEHKPLIAKAVEKRLYGRKELFDWDYPLCES